MDPSRKTNHQQASERASHSTQATSTRQASRPLRQTSFQSLPPSNPSRSPTPHPHHHHHHHHRCHPQQQQRSQQRSSSSTSGCDSRRNRNCGRYRNCRCGSAGRVCWRGRRELCGRAWDLVGVGRRRRRRSLVVVALRISRRRRKMGEHKCQANVCGGGWAGGVGLLQWGFSSTRVLMVESLVNKGRKSFLSGPSFAFLFVNCKEKNKRKKRKKKDLYAGTPVSSLLRVYKNFLFPGRSKRKRRKEKNNTRNPHRFADSSCSCLSLAESRRPHAPCDSKMKQRLA